MTDYIQFLIRTEKLPETVRKEILSLNSKYGQKKEWIRNIQVFQPSVEEPDVTLMVNIDVQDEGYPGDKVEEEVKAILAKNKIEFDLSGAS